MKGKTILIIVVLFVIITWLALNLIKEKNEVKPIETLTKDDISDFWEVDVNVPAARFK